MESERQGPERAFQLADEPWQYRIIIRGRMRAPSQNGVAALLKTGISLSLRVHDTVDEMQLVIEADNLAKLEEMLHDRSEAGRIGLPGEGTSPDPGGPTTEG